jgi:hypothetical protein
MKAHSKSRHNFLLEKLRELFDANPEKSTIKFIGQCSDCGCKTIIEITPSSGGFGIEGGALFECSPDGFFVKCSDCYKAHPEIDDNY